MAYNALPVASGNWGGWASTTGVLGMGYVIGAYRHACNGKMTHRVENDVTYT